MPDDPNPNPQPDPTPDPEPDPAPKPDPEPDFQAPKSQAELDRIVEARIARERRKFADYDEVKAKAEKYDKVLDEQKTESEREKERADKLERERDDALRKANTTLIRAEVIAEAARQNAVNGEAVYRLLPDDHGIEVDDDGNVKGVKAAVESLLADNDYLVAKQGRRTSGNGADQGARGGGNGERQLTREALQNMEPEEIRDALNKGELNEVLKTGA